MRASSGTTKPRGCGAHRGGELRRRAYPRSGAGVAQVGSKELVVQRREERGIVVAEPPPPIAPLGCQPRATAAVAAERADSGEDLPRPVLLGVADPRGEGPADPRSGVEAVKRPRSLVEAIRQGRGAKLGRLAKLLRKRCEKLRSPLRVTGPGVLPVQSDDDAGFRRQVRGHAAEVADELPGRVRFAGEAGGLEADEVREPAVPEEQRRPSARKPPWANSSGPTPVSLERSRPNDAARIPSSVTSQRTPWLP